MAPMTEDGWVEDDIAYTPEEFAEAFYCDVCGYAHPDDCE